MMTQETKMQVAIAIGVAGLFAAALFSTDSSVLENEAGNDVVPAVIQGAVKESAPVNSAAAPAKIVVPRTATIVMRSMSDAGQSGSATLTDLGGNKTRITIMLSNLQKDSAQPANIHAGTCIDFAKEAQYALSPVIKGRSVTTLNVNIGALIDKAPQSIRVRTDAVTPNVPFAACGELR